MNLDNGIAIAANLIADIYLYKQLTGWRGQTSSGVDYIFFKFLLIDKFQELPKKMISVPWLYRDEAFS